MLNRRMLPVVTLGLLLGGIVSITAKPVAADDAKTCSTVGAETVAANHISVWSFVDPGLLDRTPRGRMFRLGAGGALIDIDHVSRDRLSANSSEQRSNPGVPSAPYRLEVCNPENPSLGFIR
jgi:hypothetical protein